MSWHYSQALVEACSQADCTDGTSSQQSKSSDTISMSSSNAKTMVPSIRSQSGMTLERSTGDRFVDTWISSQQGSPVNRLVKQDNDFVETILGIFGLKPYELLGRFDRSSSSWKMSLNYCLLDTSHKWPGTWFRAGTILDGECYRLPKWERHICEIAYGLLPTPVASDWKSTGAKAEQNRRSPQIAALVGGYVHPEYLEWMMGWPIGWTALDPLEMDRFQEWLDLHGTS